MPGFVVTIFGHLIAGDLVNHALTAVVLIEQLVDFLLPVAHFLLVIPDTKLIPHIGSNKKAPEGAWLSDSHFEFRRQYAVGNGVLCSAWP